MRHPCEFPNGPKKGIKSVLCLRAVLPRFLATSPPSPYFAFAAEEFDAETLKNADDDAGFDEQAEAGAADCARQALDFVIQHEIAHARLGHRQVRRSIPELTSTAKRMLARGYEVQAYVVAAAYSMRLMFKNAQENGWTEPDLFNRIAYWSGFSHTLALGVRPLWRRYFIRIRMFAKSLSIELR